MFGLFRLGAGGVARGVCLRELRLELRANRVQRLDLPEHLLLERLLLVECRLHSRHVLLRRSLCHLRGDTLLLCRRARLLCRRRRLLRFGSRSFGCVALRLQHAIHSLRLLARSVGGGGAFDDVRRHLSFAQTHLANLFHLRLESKHLPLGRVRVVLRLEPFHSRAELLHLHADADNLRGTLRHLPQLFHLGVLLSLFRLGICASRGLGFLERVLAKPQHHLGGLQVLLQASRQLLNLPETRFEVLHRRGRVPRRRRRDAVCPRHVRLEVAGARASVVHALAPAPRDDGAKAHNLRGEFRDGTLRLLVRPRLHLDEFRALRELERRQRLLELSRGGRHAREQGASRASAERLLEQKRELRISVRDVAILTVRHVHERLDDVPERGEGLVDGGSLLQANPRGLGGSLALGSGEVHQMEQRRTFLQRGARVRPPPRFERQREHGVGSTRLAVHLRHPHASVYRSAGEEVVGLLRARHGRLDEPLDKDALLIVFSNVRLRRGSRLGEEIRHRLVVNLEVRALHRELHLTARSARGRERRFGVSGVHVEARLLVFDALEDALQDAGDEALLLGVVHGGRSVALLRAVGVIVGTLHRECLSRARLAVRDETSVVPLEEGVRHRDAHRLEDLSLGLMLVAHVVVAVRGVVLGGDVHGLTGGVDTLGVALRETGRGSEGSAEGAGGGGAGGGTKTVARKRSRARERACPSSRAFGGRTRTRTWMLSSAPPRATTGAEMPSKTASSASVIVRACDSRAVMCLPRGVVVPRTPKAVDRCETSFPRGRFGIRETQDETRAAFLGSKIPCFHLFSSDRR